MSAQCATTAIRYRVYRQVGSGDPTQRGTDIVATTYNDAIDEDARTDGAVYQVVAVIYPGKEYELVSAGSNSVVLEPTVPIEPIEPVGRPSLEIVGRDGAGTVTLRWTDGEGTTPITGYQVHRGIGSEQVKLVDTIGQASGWSDPEPMHRGDESRFYHVVAIAADGRHSAASNSVSTLELEIIEPVEPVARPSLEIVGRDSAGTVTLRWTDGEGTIPISGYKVYRSIGSSGIALMETLGQASGWSDPDPMTIGGAARYYHVVAVGTDGRLSRPSNTVSTLEIETVLDTQVGPPTQVCLVGFDSTNRALIRWNAPVRHSDGAAEPIGYKIFRGDSPSRAIAVELPDGEVGLVSAWQDSVALATGTVVYYHVRTKGSDESLSRASNTISTLDRPCAEGQARGTSSSAQTPNAAVWIEPEAPTHRWLGALSRGWAASVAHTARRQANAASTGIAIAHRAGRSAAGDARATLALTSIGTTQHLGEWSLGASIGQARATGNARDANHRRHRFDADIESARALVAHHSASGITTWATLGVGWGALDATPPRHTGTAGRSDVERDNAIRMHSAGAGVEGSFGATEPFKAIEWSMSAVRTSFDADTDEGTARASTSRVDAGIDAVVTNTSEGSSTRWSFGAGAAREHTREHSARGDPTVVRRTLSPELRTRVEHRRGRSTTMLGIAHGTGEEKAWRFEAALNLALGHSGTTLTIAPVIENAAHHLSAKWDRPALWSPIMTIGDAEPARIGATRTLGPLTGVELHATPEEGSVRVGLRHRY